MSPPQSLNEPENLDARSTRKQTMNSRRAHKQAHRRMMPPPPPPNDGAPEPTVADDGAPEPNNAELMATMISNQQLLLSRLERLEGIIRDSDGPRSPAAAAVTPAKETPVKKQNVEVPKKNAIPLTTTLHSATRRRSSRPGGSTPSATARLSLLSRLSPRSTCRRSSLTTS